MLDALALIAWIFLGFVVLFGFLAFLVYLFSLPKG